MLCLMHRMKENNLQVGLIEEGKRTEDGGIEGESNIGLYGNDTEKYINLYS